MFTKDRTQHIRQLCDDFDNQWDVCEANKQEQADADAALTAADQELQKAAQMYSPSSPEYQAAAKKQADAAAARQAQYDESAADNQKLDGIQNDMINSAKYLRG